MAPNGEIIVMITSPWELYAVYLHVHVFTGWSWVELSVPEMHKEQVMACSGSEVVLREHSEMREGVALRSIEFKVWYWMNAEEFNNAVKTALAKVLKYHQWAYYTWKYTVASGRMWTHNRIHCIIIRLRMQLLEKLGFWGRKPLSTSHNHTNLIAMHTSFWRTRNFQGKFWAGGISKGINWDCFPGAGLWSRAAFLVPCM